jgi:galactose mutarotase-like enzyme
VPSEGRETAIASVFTGLRLAASGVRYTHAGVTRALLDETLAHATTCDRRPVSGHSLRGDTRDGFGAEVLCSPANGGIEAWFVPGAGMVCCSLRHRGDELLGQRRGLAYYADKHSTMGIPLLHPWANRVSESRFELLGRQVDAAEASGALYHDANGLPMHGLLAGAREWEVVDRDAGPDAALLRARFDFAARADLMAAFPFPHEVEIEAALRDATLCIATTVTATGGAAVPIAFGYHPYLRVPDVAREQWSIEVPVDEQVVLDERSLPTGERHPAHVDGGPLAGRTFDDLYAGVRAGAVFSVAGGDRRLEIEFTDGYPVAVVFAPDADDVICFEPMTAPTNALVTGAPELRVVQPGERFTASFSIHVS